MIEKPWYEHLFELLAAAWTKHQLGISGASPDMLQGAVTTMADLPTLYDRDSSEDQIRKVVVLFCEAQVGEPYVYGAEGPDDADLDKWDCSELFQHAFIRSGLAYPDGCVNQKRIMEHRRLHSPKPADVAFYGPNKNGIPHTIICAGNGFAIHADGGAARKVRKVPIAEIEAHPRFEGWFRHPDLAYPPEDRA